MKMVTFAPFSQYIVLNVNGDLIFQKFGFKILTILGNPTKDLVHLELFRPFASEALG